MPFSHPEATKSLVAIQFSLVLLLGAALGGGIGFYLGRSTAPANQQPFEADASTPAALSQSAASAPVDQAPDTPPAPLGPAGAPASAARIPGSAAPARPTPAAQAADERLVDATIRGSLYSTLADHLEGREADILSAQIGRLLIWWLDARRDVLRGDRVQVLYVPDEGPGQLRILALRYHSAKLDKTFQAYRFQIPGATHGRYYDETGQEVEKRLDPSPIQDYEQVTELMSLAGRRHHGVDFKTDVGTPVTSPFRAKVARKNWTTRRNGNCLHLTYLDTGTSAIFLHLDEILPIAKPGTILAAGTEVAKAGNTGRSTAPHLHYELHSASGRLLNPFEFHKTSRIQLGAEQLPAFGAQVERMAAKFQGPLAGSSASE